MQIWLSGETTTESEGTTSLMEMHMLDRDLAKEPLLQGICINLRD